MTAREGKRVAGPIVYRLSAKSDPAILTLVAGASIVVSVKDEKKQPIADAEVQADEEAGASGKTDKDGNVTISPVTPGWVGVQAKAPGYAANSGFTAVGASNAVGKIEITLHPGVNVSGHVVDEQHNPIAKASVSTQGIWNLGSSVTPTETDDKGAFTLVLASGTHTLVATDKVHALSKSTPFVVSDKPIDNIEVVMKAGGLVAGRVVDTNKNPVPFATVRTSGKGTDLWSTPRRTTTADKDGRFEIKGLSRIKLDVRAESDEAASKMTLADLTTAGEKKDLELVLDVKGLISGVVVDDKGQLVPEVHVNAFPDVWGGASEENIALAGFTNATTDGAGHFAIHGLPDGSYKLRASRTQEGARFDLEGTTAKTGDTSVRLVLAAPGGIKGAVAKSDGSPPMTASVRVGWRPGVPTQQGKFEMDNLEPGKYDVTVHGMEFADIIKRDVVVKAGETTDLGQIVVATGRTLTGRVIDASGNPVTGARVKAGRMLMSFQGAEDQASTFEDASGTRSAYTDGDGKFTLVGISPAELNAMAEHPDKGRSSAVEVPAGADDPPPIQLQLKGFGTITGKVTIEGQPATGISVTDTPKAGGAQILIAQADDTGAFTIGKASEGPHTVSAVQQGGFGTSFKSTSTTVNVVAGQTVNVTLDIKVGNVELDVAIAPASGATVNAAQVFLFHDQQSIATAKDVQTAFIGGKGVGMKFWTGGAPIAFDSLMPGEYSACSIPITGNMQDATFMQRLQENSNILKVYCTPATVAPSPAKQTVSQQLPTMTPLPPPK
ncbi:MAG: carboxypeptidase-like regulatory domain-containing protein [Kofleriaceae bacterium]